MAWCNASTLQSRWPQFDIGSGADTLRAVLLRFARWMSVLALMLSLGAHWAFLQSVAWVGMIVSYSRDGSFTEAVSKTFDGQHPCAMCEAIKQGRAEEKQREQKQLKPESKLDPGLVWQPVAFIFACDRARNPCPDCFAPSRREAPPKPRPRQSVPDHLA